MVKLLFDIALMLALYAIIWGLGIVRLYFYILDLIKTKLLKNIESNLTKEEEVVQFRIDVSGTRLIKIIGAIIFGFLILPVFYCPLTFDGW